MAHGAPHPEKAALRKEVWAALQAAGAGRFPGIVGRIPNFVGAEAAARLLAAHPLFQDAQVLKCNPDSPQRPVRHAALKAGKVVFLAVPRLRSAEPFLRLDPRELPPGSLWKASSIKGADALGVPVAISEVPPLDLIVTGCVGVGADGARLGKGGGYSDLEYALLREAGLVTEHTPIVTTLHPVQWLAPVRIPVEEHDISVDVAALPDEVRVCVGRRPRPPGVLWDRLAAEQVEDIPVLAALAGGGR